MVSQDYNCQSVALDTINQEETNRHESHCRLRLSPTVKAQGDTSAFTRVVSYQNKYNLKTKGNYNGVVKFREVKHLLNDGTLYTTMSELNRHI